MEKWKNGKNVNEKNEKYVEKFVDTWGHRLDVAIARNGKDTGY